MDNEQIIQISEEIEETTLSVQNKEIQTQEQQQNIDVVKTQTPAINAEDVEPVEITMVEWGTSESSQSTPLVNKDIVIDCGMLTEDKDSIELDDLLDGGISNAGTTNHAELNGREFPDQHPIVAITGLRDELDSIECLKRSLHADGRRFAQYYRWYDTNPLHQNRDGYFVSLVEGTNYIKICDGTSEDVFGVIIPAQSTAFVGGFTEELIQQYGLVCFTGDVNVIRYNNVATGDCVLPNASGIAHKSDCSGYKVIAVGNNGGTLYATINLGENGKILSVLRNELDTLTQRIATDEQTLTQAIATNAGNISDIGTLANRLSSALDDAEDELDALSQSVSDAQDSVQTALNDASIAKDTATTAANAAIAAKNTAVTNANAAVANVNQLIGELEPITEWEDPDTGNTGAEYFVQHIQDDCATKTEVATVTTKAENALTAVSQNAKLLQSLASVVKKYVVGPQSQGYGLTLAELQSTLVVGYIYVPTTTHNEGDFSFTSGKSYRWSGTAWDENKSVFMQSTYPTAGDINHPLWYNTATNAITNNNVIYEPETLYLWHDDMWVAVASLQESSLARVTSMIKQTADALIMEIVNARGSYASLGARLTDEYATVSASTVWVNEHKTAITNAIQKSDDNEAYIDHIANYRSSSIVSTSKSNNPPSGTVYADVPTWDETNSRWTFANPITPSTYPCTCYGPKATNASTYYRYMSDDSSVWYRDEISRSINSTADIQQLVNDHEAKINSLTSWSGNTPNETITSVSQKSDANKAEIDALTSYNSCKLLSTQRLDVAPTIQLYEHQPTWLNGVWNFGDQEKITIDTNTVTKYYDAVTGDTSKFYRYDYDVIDDNDGDSSNDVSVWTRYTFAFDSSSLADVQIQSTENESRINSITSVVSEHSSSITNLSQRSDDNESEIAQLATLQTFDVITTTKLNAEPTGLFYTQQPTWNSTNETWVFSGTISFTPTSPCYAEKYTGNKLYYQYFSITEDGEPVWYRNEIGPSTYSKAGIISRVNEAESTLNSITEWKDDTNTSLTNLQQRSNKDEAYMSHLAKVKHYDTVAVEELSSAPTGIFYTNAPSWNTSTNKWTFSGAYSTTPTSPCYGKKANNATTYYKYSSTVVNSATVWYRDEIGETSSSLASIEQEVDDQGESIGMVVTHTSGGKVLNRAGIVASINNNTNESYIEVDADHVDFNGKTIAISATNDLTITAGNGFKLDKSGMSWTTESNPLKMVYSQTLITKPADNTPYSSFPTSSSTNWHKTATALDKYASETTDGGATWGEVRKIVGDDGQNGSDGIDGVSPYTCLLTNDSHIIPTDKDGSNGNYTGCSTTMQIYYGSTDDSSNWTVSASKSSGITGSLSGKTYTVTAMTTDTGYVDLTASKTGCTSLTRRFTLSKSKQGISGTSPTAYWLISSSAAIQKNIEGAYTPTSISFYAKSQTGTASPSYYSGRFIIAETTNGTTYTNKYTSSTNENSKTYTPSASIKAIRCRLYLAGGTTTLLDEEIIPVVSDGANGQDGYTPVKGVDYFDGTNGTNGTDGADGVSIIFKGSYSSAPSNPQNGWAYYNTTEKKSFVYQGSAWYQMSVDGINGQNGNDGLSIVWKGESSAPPSNPQVDWVYKDSDDGKVYIYNGTGWEIMVLDGSDGEDGSNGINGESVYITYNDNAADNTPATPTGSGTTGGWHTNATSSVVWISQKIAPSANEGTWGTPIRIKGTDGEDGNNGISVTGVIEQYCAHSSNTTAPTTGWSETIPSVTTQNPYMWRRQKVTYSSGDPTYTTPYLDTYIDIITGQSQNGVMTSLNNVIEYKTGDGYVLKRTGVISSINGTTAETNTKIMADKIDLEGVTTFVKPGDLSENGTTVIDGSRITTGSIQSSDYEEEQNPESIQVPITIDNINEYFKISNGNPYYFQWSAGECKFITNNITVNSSTAQTTLTAKCNMDINFNYSYSSESNYDKFTLIVNGVTVKNADAVSGISMDNTYTGKIETGQTIILKYIKDGSKHYNDDRCTFYNMVITVASNIQQDFIYSADGTKFDLSNGVIQSKNFSITADGSTYLKGDINTAGGTIGGWNINDHSLFSSHVYSPRPLSEIESTIDIDDSNIGDYFECTHERTYTFGWNSSQSQWISNNLGVDYSKADIILTALFDMYVSFDYFYVTEANADLFYVSINGQQLNGSPFSGSNSGNFYGYIYKGQKIAFDYTKGQTTSATNETCGFEHFKVANIDTYTTGISCSTKNNVSSFDGIKANVDNDNIDTYFIRTNNAKYFAWNNTNKGFISNATSNNKKATTYLEAKFDMDVEFTYGYDTTSDNGSFSIKIDQENIQGSPFSGNSGGGFKFSCTLYAGQKITFIHQKVDAVSAGTAYFKNMKIVQMSESVRFYSGVKEDGQYPFMVTDKGNLYSTTGYIGGWTIGNDILKYEHLDDTDDKTYSVGLYCGNKNNVSINVDNEILMTGNNIGNYFDITNDPLYTFTWDSTYGVFLCKNTSANTIAKITLKAKYDMDIKFNYDCDCTERQDYLHVYVNGVQLPESPISGTIYDECEFHGTIYKDQTIVFVYNKKSTDSSKDLEADFRLFKITQLNQVACMYSGERQNEKYPFMVTDKGALYATDAEISGSITANSGSVGGWSISSTKIYHSYSTGEHDGVGMLYSGGALIPSLWQSGVNSPVVFYAGAKNNDPYPNSTDDCYFGVLQDGSVYCQAMKADNFIFNSGRISDSVKIGTNASYYLQIEPHTTSQSSTAGVELRFNNDDDTKLSFYNDRGGNHASLQASQEVNIHSATAIGINAPSVTMGYGTSGGAIVPYATATLTTSSTGFDLGSTSYIWRIAYRKGISTTSARIYKKEIESFTDNFDKLFDNLKPRKFKYNFAESDRLHYGFIVDEVGDAFESAGLTANDCGAYQLYDKADKYGPGGLNYEEFVALNTWQIQQLKARVAELERIIRNGTTDDNQDEQYENGADTTD